MRRNCSPARKARLRISSILIPAALMIGPAFAQFAEYRALTSYQSLRPQAAVNGDVDGDGDLDIVVASRGDHRVGWYENLGGGSFGPIRVITDQARDCQGVALADLDADGDLDVLCASSGDDSVTWSENLGAGTFGNRRLVAAPIAAPHDTDAADLDGDGVLDVLASSTSSGQVVWARGLGGGAFVTSWSSIGSLPQVGDIHATDFDGDGDIDVFAGAGINAPSGGARLFSNAGSAAGWAMTFVPIGFGWGAISSMSDADVDGDGDADLVFAARERGMHWLENTGGALTTPELIAGTVAAEGAILLDADGDGVLDGLVGGAFGAYLAPGLGAAAFGPKVQILDAGYLKSLTVGDYDGDGRSDFGWIQWTNSGAVGWSANSAAGFSNDQRVLNDPDLERPRRLASADLDMDGDQDLIVGSSVNGEVHWLENQGGGNFERPEAIVTLPQAASHVEAADVDGDGDPDLVVASDRVVLIENLGGMTFAAPVAITSSTLAVGRFKIRDVDGDGMLDVVSISYSRDKLLFSRNLGAGSFAAPQMVTTGVTWPTGVDTGDLDGDGDLDIVVSEANVDEITWVENLGAGAFAPGQVLLSPFGDIRDLVVEDLDGDGHQDIAWYTRLGMRWLPGLGSATFPSSSLSIPAPGNDTVAFAVADLDLDGDLDVVYGDNSGSPSQPTDVGLVKRSSTGSYGGATIITSRPNGLQFSGLLLVDVDADGDEDVITASYGDQAVGLCLNLTIDNRPVGHSYCTPAIPNSSGQAATLSLYGSDVAADNQLRLLAEDLPPQQFGLFIAGRTQDVVPNAGGSQGTLCLGGTIARVLDSVQSSGPSGRLEYSLDLDAIPMTPPVAVLIGQTWNFQGWYRDANPGATSNFTAGATVTFR